MRLQVIFRLGLGCAAVLIGCATTPAPHPLKEMTGVEAFNHLVVSQFEKYPVALETIGAKHALRLNTRVGRTYRTRLLAEWTQASEPNFANTFYAFKQIGCGAGCQVLVIADWGSGVLTETKIHATFETRRDSRAIVLSPAPDCAYLGPHEVYVMAESRHIERVVENYCRAQF